MERKVADTNCLPNMQILISCFGQQASWPGFSPFPWSVRGGYLLGSTPRHPGFLAAHRASSGRVAEWPQEDCLATGSLAGCPSWVHGDGAMAHAKCLGGCRRLQPSPEAPHHGHVP